MSLIIEGGIKLNGEAAAAGAKNAALPILAATILVDGYTELTNIPYLQDDVKMIRMLNALNIRTEFHFPDTVKIWNQRKIKK